MPISAQICCPPCDGTSTGGQIGKNFTVTAGGSTSTTFIPNGGTFAGSACADVPIDPAFWQDIPADGSEGGTFCATCINGTITSIESRPVDPNTGQGVGAWTDTGEV